MHFRLVIAKKSHFTVTGGVIKFTIVLFRSRYYRLIGPKSASLGSDHLLSNHRGWSNEQAAVVFVSFFDSFPVRGTNGNHRRQQDVHAICHC